MTFDPFDPYRVDARFVRPCAVEREEDDMASVVPERPALDWPEWMERFFTPRRPGRWLDFPGFPEWMQWPALRVEEYREDDTLVVRAELPGVDPDKDIEISIAEGKLTIRAQRNESTKEERKGHFRSEFQYGSFVRTVPLPPGADESSVQASYTDGILEVRVPIETEPAAPKQIEIKRT
jgi:HSP20 family protein